MSVIRATCQCSWIRLCLISAVPVNAVGFGQCLLSALPVNAAGSVHVRPFEYFLDLGVFVAKRFQGGGKLGKRQNTVFVRIVGLRGDRRRCEGRVGEVVKGGRVGVVVKGGRVRVVV